MSEMFDDKEVADDDERTPYERTPYALWAYEEDGALPTRTEEATFVLHKDLETEYLHVMLFEALDDAYKTLTEFTAATGRKAEPKRTEVRSIGEHFHIRLFRADGKWHDMSLSEYLHGMA
ncbi:MAG: hypothetical protein H7Z41_01415 [Cytophagales bacterium]|nr:hypothetical protein [Armatimonadota bacterium]